MLSNKLFHEQVDLLATNLDSNYHKNYKIFTDTRTHRHSFMCLSFILNKVSDLLECFLHVSQGESETLIVDFIY